jgi:hypothetical protein
MTAQFTILGVLMGFTFGVFEVISLLDTDTVRLNKLLSRLKIREELEGGGTRGKRLHFSTRDICKLALAFALFQGGLRWSEIERVLAHKVTKQALLGLNGLEDLRAEAERSRLLVTWRPTARAKRQVAIVDSPDLNLGQGAHLLVIVPFSRLLKGILAT